jgi:hypothetical protein
MRTPVEHPTTGLRLLMRGHNNRIRPTSALDIYAGYRHIKDERVYLLYRWRHHPAGDHAGTLKVETRGRIRIGQLDKNDLISDREWEHFLRLNEGVLIIMQSLAPTLWVKLTRDEIEKIVRDRSYTFAGLRRRNAV